MKTFVIGEKATAEAIGDAIPENRAEIVHLAATMDLDGITKGYLRKAWHAKQVGLCIHV